MRSAHETRRQQELIRNGAFLDVPSLDTPATRFMAAIAEQLDRHDWHVFNDALYAVLMLIARGLRSDDNGLRLPDRAPPGHVFLVFSNNGGGCCGGNVALAELDDARRATITSTALGRRERLLKMVKLASAQRDRMGEPASREWAIEVAGLLVTLDDIEALEAGTDALPALVILTRRERGRRAVRAKTVVATLPGSWLGVRPAAGRA